MDRLGTYAVFAAVAEHESFAAARSLDRAPASVTRAVAALEAEVGARLLNRNTLAVSLTEAGAQHLTAPSAVFPRAARSCATSTARAAPWREHCGHCARALRAPRFPTFAGAFT